MTTFSLIAVLIGAAACSSAVLRIVELFERPAQFQRGQHHSAM